MTTDIYIHCKHGEMRGRFDIYVHSSNIHVYNSRKCLFAPGTNKKLHRIAAV